MATLQSAQHGLRVLDPSCRDIGHARHRVAHQKQMDALTLKLVVVVEPVRSDDGHIALAVLGNHFLGAGLHLIRQLRERGSCLRQGNDLASRYRQGGLQTAVWCTRLGATDTPKQRIKKTAACLRAGRAARRAGEIGPVLGNSKPGSQPQHCGAGGNW